ncbi:flagellar hook-basal body complex protein [Alicyclobacillus tolerans]|uniref:flagellar hook-basal body complex protein n=1 Tax=Alicyclobacillus tolerans TaxID=90970 RepID=UPI001F16A4D9|nr:flagellar hook-basal body complex protein [Alicyclobacillus tolerans]MCF8568070.1 flagellar hook-basal body complex protein [Alicyclobacillus tolerans]
MGFFDAPVSGMDTFQTMMNVVGNNISNANTTGYKSSEINFADLLSQTMQTGSAGSATGLGGTNPQQVGLGVKVASISPNFTEGSLSQTGNPTDIAIQGNGLFAVSPNPSGSPLYYTRAGNFQIDSNGNLVTANGDYVMASSSQVTGTSSPQWTPINVNTTPTMNIPGGATIGSFSYVNSSGQTTTGGPIALSSTKSAVIQGPTTTSTASGSTPSWTVTGGDKLVITDTSTTPPTVTTYPFPSSSTPSTTITSATPTASDVPSGYTISYTDANGNSKTLALSPTQTATMTGATLTYNSTNQSWSATGGSQITVTDSSTTPSTVSNYQMQSGSTAQITVSAPETTDTPSQYTIGQDGTITVQGGKTYYLPLANFANPSGLQKVGDNLFVASSGGNQGAPAYGQPGSPNFGSIQQGMLENSNVDLTKELSNMLVAQTGYSANSKVISTQNQMFQTLMQNV